MKSMKSIVFCVIISGLICLVWTSSIHADKKRVYEVRPSITLPEYKSDTVRTIDAYERMMDRYMNLTERNFNSIGSGVQEMNRKLDLIDARLTKMSSRLMKIEKALGKKKPMAPKANKKKSQKPSEGACK